MSAPADDDVPTLQLGGDDAMILDALRQVQRAVLLHPEACRAGFEALRREGRLFAQTAEGARWHARLSHSALLARAQFVAQIASFWVTEEQSEGSTPSALVEAIASAAASSGRDRLIDRLLRQLDGEASDA
jgi:hypothetical protein